MHKHLVHYLQSEFNSRSTAQSLLNRYILCKPIVGNSEHPMVI